MIKNKDSISNQRTVMLPASINFLKKESLSKSFTAYVASSPHKKSMTSAAATSVI